MFNFKSLFSGGRKKDMSTETLSCGKRTYILECRVTKNGHKYIMITEKSFGRMSKVMLFHDHFDEFRSALDRVTQAEPVISDAAVN
jgi:hypothetical protein